MNSTNGTLPNSMGSWTRSSEIAARSDWDRAVTRASEWITERLGRWVEGKQWEWSVNDKNGQPHFDLLMTYGGSSLSDRFSFIELVNESIVKERTWDVWGRLIDEEVHAAFNSIRKTLNEMKEEESLAAVH